MSVFFVQNPRLVTTYARNRPPFTSVHSHAAAQKSSGAFFRVMVRERCRKRPARVRSALRGSAGVRARDVMVNSQFFSFLLRPASLAIAIAFASVIALLLIAESNGLKAWLLPCMFRGSETLDIRCSSKTHGSLCGIQ